ncbi:MAG: signal peptidase I [Lachnospiraceae bacterium]|nr:signal peptidase I [Lachnospiraceae bacterium]
MNDTLKELLKTSLYLLGLLLLALFIVTFIGQRTIVDGTSMCDTLSDKDNLIVDKITYRFRNPERFEVIVFPYQKEKRNYFIKRVIGLPGETVYIDEDGNIFINDVLLEENFGRERIEDPGIAINPIVLGEDEYFVMGDNRNDSFDSRFTAVGNIKKENIIGRAWLRIYPFKKIGFVNQGKKDREK